MAKEIYTSNVEQRTNLMLIVWISLLWISDLPDLLFYYLIGPVPAWLIYVKFSLMLGYTGVCAIVKHFKPLLPYAFFMVLFIGGVMGFDWIQNQFWWKIWFPAVDSSFFWGYAKIYVLNIGLVMLVIATMWLIKRNRVSTFLARGN